MILEGSGMTELPPFYSLNPPNARKLGSIGRPVPGVSLRLVDEHRRDVPPGDIGEILLKSEALMVGYWQDPEATAAVLQDGWLATGDLARCDEDGYYWFAGRKKEIIIRGGSNISPQEVEAVLVQHPAVRAAGVVGVPDATWGEVVHAYVALREGAAATEAERRQFMGERLAAYKVPEAIHFLAQLPLGATGKVHRKTLREWAVAAAGGRCDCGTEQLFSQLCLEPLGRQDLTGEEIRPLRLNLKTHRPFLSDRAGGNLEIGSN
jgi:long-chain acyl-CoA synthetase